MLPSIVLSRILSSSLGGSQCCVRGFHCMVHIEISKRVDKSLGAVLILLPGKKKKKKTATSVQSPSGLASLMYLCEVHRARNSPSWSQALLESQLPARPRRLCPWSPRTLPPSAAGHRLLRAAYPLFSVWQMCFTISSSSQCVPQMIHSDSSTCHLNPVGTFLRAVYSF